MSPLKKLISRRDIPHVCPITPFVRTNNIIKTNIHGACSKLNANTGFLKGNRVKYSLSFPYDTLYEYRASIRGLSQNIFPLASSANVSASSCIISINCCSRFFDLRPFASNSTLEK